MLRSGIGIVLALLLIYGLTRAWPLLTGPSITLSSPTEGASVPDGFVTVAGTAHHTETLTLDGGPLLIDEQGAFSTSLLLPHGSAILSLTATDRFGRSATKRRAVFVP